MLNSNINLYEQSATFPEIEKGILIPVDSRLREIKKRFNSDISTVMLTGASGTGKTVLLSEFTRENNDVTFSYFITDNFWTWRQTSFLRSLCQQMKYMVSDGDTKSSSDLDSVELDAERLRTLFANLAQKVIDIAKKRNVTFYFVVDSLDLAFNGRDGEKIIDLFPLPEHSKYLKFLGSVSPLGKDKLKELSGFKKTEFVEPATFSSLEIRTYFEQHSLSLTEHELNSIQTISGGVPGYLYVIRKLLVENRIPISQLLEHPSELENLLRLQWSTLELDKNDGLKKLLAILAFSITPLKIQTISEILDLPFNQIQDTLFKTGIVNQDVSGNLAFYPQLHKSIAKKLLSGLQNSSIELLIRYYKKLPNNKDAKLLLPEYYLHSKNLEALQEFITPASLVSNIVDNQGLGGIKRYLGMATELAVEQGKNDQVFKYSLLSSQLHTLSNEIVGESEVAALIAMMDYEGAMKLAYSAKIIHLRIRLLSQIYREMERNGKIVSKSERNELEQMVNSLNVKDLDPDEILAIASEIFPILPDCSMSLVDSAKLTQGNQTAMDVMVTLASINSEKTAKDNDVLGKIGDTALQEAVLTHSPWLTKLSANEVIQKANQVTQTKAKVYLLREWCLQNKQDVNAHLVINFALDTIIGDSSYKVPLRDLRQISESLRNCPADLILSLCKRFDIPLFTSLRSPFEERVRLELNLAEAISKTDALDARERFYKVYNEINEATFLDADISCYSLARLLISLDVLNLIINDPTITKSIQTKIDDEFVRLIDTSANQYKVSRKILRVLSFTDPKKALVFAELLNISSRRDKAIQSVLMAYISQDRLDLTAELIETGLEKIEDSIFREQTIYHLVDLAKRENKLELLRNYWLQKADLIQDVIIKCKIYSRIMCAFPGDANREIRDGLFDKLISNWEKVDILWYRIEMAFDLVTIIATVDKTRSEELFKLAVNIRDQSPLANQTLGGLLLETLSIAPELMGYFDLNNSDAKQTWDSYLNAIDLLPSQVLRIHLMASVAVARLHQGDKANFDKIIQNHIINKLHLLYDSENKQRVIASILYAIFEYSPEEAKKIADNLSYFFKNAAWWNVAYRTLTKTNLEDIVEEQTPNISIDLSRANKAMRALAMIETDERISGIVNLFTHLIGLSIAELSEAQKLDLLSQIEKIIEDKLPDLKNIDHSGYKLLALASVEKTKRQVAKRAKNLIVHRDHEIIEAIKGIDNIADKVYVNGLIAAEFMDFDKKCSNKLAEEAFTLVSQIPNIQDRIDRLEIITKTYSQLRNTSKVSESIKLGVNLARSLDGIQKDSLLASIIQMAYQLDKTLAAEITEKIEDASTGYSVNIYKKSLDLSKSPQKLLTNFDEYSKNEEVIKDAASKMLRSLLSGKGTSHPDKTVNTWLLASSKLNFETGNEVSKWAIAETIRATPKSRMAEFSLVYAKNLLYICEIMLQIGSHISFLSKIPESLKTSFQGLSSTQEIFKVGERNRGIEWISTWLRQNAREYVKICDPYFNKEQLWVVKAIPADIVVKIICAEKGLGLKTKENITKSERKEQTRNVVEQFNFAWNESCSQIPPETLIVIHETVNDSEEKDEFHDRFIVTKGGGLSIGSSLNGLGKKECVIKMLSSDDSTYIEENYINPKQNIAEIFSKVMYFELG